MRPKLDTILTLFLCGLLAFGQAVALPARQEQEGATSRTQAYEQLTESYVERIRREGSFLELSLTDAIRLALTNNLDIAIQNYQEELNRNTIFGTKGFYDPQVSFTVGWRSSTSPATSVLDAGGGISVRQNDGFTWNNSFSQQIPYGGRIQLSLNNSRTFSNSSFSTFNPSYGTGFDIQFTQPLWRGFINTQTERSLKLQNLDLEISDLAFEERVSGVVRQVQDRYWDMVGAINSYDAARRSMNLAIIRYNDSQKRVEIGIEAPIEITSARSEVASRQQSMIQTEVGISDADNDLKNLLAPKNDDPMWDLRIIPTDRPNIEDLRLNLKESIQLALQRRPEMKEYDKEFQRVAINRKFLKREGKPRVDLTFSYGSTGQAGNSTISIDTDGDGFPDTTVPNPDNAFPGNFTSSIGRAFGFDFTNYNISATVTIPLRNRSNASSLAAEAINERRLQSQVRQTQQQIAVEVRKAHRQIEIQKERLNAARVARELAEEQLDGENKRFEAGLSTNFEVLRIQRDLADAIQNELAAEIDYVKSITSLRQAMYTLIESTDIVLAKSPSPED